MVSGFGGFGWKRVPGVAGTLSLGGSSELIGCVGGSVAPGQMTMLMILPGTTITFFGVLPSIHFWASGTVTTSA